jgi:hypothetical protein
VRQPLLGVRERARPVGGPLRRGQAQAMHQLAQRGRGQRGVLGDDQVDQHVHARADLGLVGQHRPRLARGVDARAGVAPCHAQQAAVVHRVEQLGRGVARAAEPVDDLAVVEVRVDLARMHGAALAHESEHRVGLGLARLAPAQARLARMHQRVVPGAEEAVVDEEVLFDAELGIAAFEVARDVAVHAVAQREVLRACRCAQRIGLHEAQAVDRLRQRGGGEQAARQREAAQRGEVEAHRMILPPATRRPHELPTDGR